MTEWGKPIWTKKQAEKQKQGLGEKSLAFFDKPATQDKKPEPTKKEATTEAKVETKPDPKPVEKKSISAPIETKQEPKSESKVGTKSEETKTASYPLGSKQEETKKADSKKKDYHPPDPSRFTSYTLLPDKTGFMIDGCNHVFYFEEDGGWYDEYDNYYNADGEPEEEEESYDDDGGDDLLGGYEIDEYDDDDYGDQGYEKYDSFYANQENVRRLADYLDDEYVKIQFSNISFKSQMGHFFEYLRKYCRIHFFNEDYEKFGYNGHKGTCQITCENKKAAEAAIELNDRNFEGRNIRVLVVKREDFDADEN